MYNVFNPGLYAVTAQRYPDLARLVREVQLALDGGAAMVQFRDKSGDQGWRAEAAQALVVLCRARDTPLLINDDVKLAMDVGAAGVHLGRDDMPVARARELMGQRLLIGVSCYNSLDRAERAVAGGADHLAFGSMYPSANKPGAVRCPPDLITRAAALGVPLVAIGGITPDNGRAVVAAGADSLAVIGALFDAPDVRLAAESFSEIWAL